MSMIFVHIYNFFNQRKWFALLLFIAILCLALVFAFRIHFSEDISQLSSGNNKDAYSTVLKNLKFSDKLFINISCTDENSVDPEILTSFADDLADSLMARLFPNHISQITTEIPSELMAEAYSMYYNNLPVFMVEQDYQRLDSLLIDEGITKTLENNYKALISPAGIVFKQYITSDPFGIAANSLKRLQSFQISTSYDFYDGYIFTKDRKHLLLVVSTTFPPSETSGNDYLINTTQQIIRQLASAEKFRSAVKAEYYGAAAVAVANARQVKNDIILTVSLSLFIILLFVGWFHRSAVIPLVSYLPALIGGSITIALVFLIRHNISAIALGIGSVLLGIIVDYSIYMFNLFRIKKDTEIVIKELSLSILLCAFSSAAAFFSLLFVQSRVLQDLGLFAGLSVIIAAFSTVLFLPLILKATTRKDVIPRVTWVDKITSIPFHKSRLLFYSILLIAIISFFVSSQVQFEDNLNKLNFVPSDLQKAEANLNNTTGAEFKPLYFICTGKTKAEALKVFEQHHYKLEILKKEGVIENYSGINHLVISDSLQRKRIAVWNEYWTRHKKDSVKMMLAEKGLLYKFRDDAFSEFYSLLDKDFQPVDVSESVNISKYFLDDRIIEKPGFAMIVTIVSVDSLSRDVLISSLGNIKNAYIIDRQMITNKMILSVKDDFHVLVSLCMILVSTVLIFAYGRIELGIIASLPMFLSWYITLGLILILGLKLNIINIIVCTFIFGLGVDYSILMMRGLLQEYKTGRSDLAAYKNAIFISAFTTFIGVGVLIFAKHPALKSIALISMIGVFTVVVITYTTIPVMFKWLTNNKYGKRPLPITFFRGIGSASNYFFYLFFSALILIFSLLLKLVPINSYRKLLIIRFINCYFSRWTMLFMFMARKNYINMPHDLEKNPAIIIANHQSLIDIPLTIMVSKRIILVPSERVWKSHFTGWLIKLAGFFPSNIGYDQLIIRLRDELSYGNSVIFFPEGTRTSGNYIRRFHKGAFYLAEQLQADIVPMVIYGSSHLVPKGEIVGNRSTITVKFLPRIKPNDHTYGNSYQEKTIQIQNLFRNEFNQIREQCIDPGYNKRKLINNFVYKGPVLEWYLKVKLMLESNYQLFNKFASSEGRIVDIGCGYGFISYMLYFMSDKRKILGIDNDADKVSVANNCVSKTDDIEFVCADIINFSFPMADTFILCDVLHYLPLEEQKKLIIRCIEHTNEKGVILIRDGDASLKSKHKQTRLTEFFSTNIGFNKAKYRDLQFPDRHLIIDIAGMKGFKVDIIENKKHTSNVLFILSKK